VSEVCRRHGISAGQFYDWEAHAKRGALEGLRQGNRKPKGQDQGVQQQHEIERLREVIAEISAENLALKKGRWL
jgi:transposase-like protein